MRRSESVQATPTRINKDDRGFLYVDPQYLRDIQQFIRLGRFKISNDRYKYSTNNIVLPHNFNIDNLFLDNETANIKISKERLKDAKEELEKVKMFGDRRRGDPPFYYKKEHEFMTLEDYLEFYHKFYEKRKEEAEKQRYKLKFANEVDKIKRLKTHKFIETETLKLGGSLTRDQRDKLDQKIVMFQNGLNYAIEKLNYQQAQKMLRKLNAIPQPPMKLALGKRTRLYSFKTPQNLNKALHDVMNEPGLIESHPEFVAFQKHLEEKNKAYANLPNEQLGERLKKDVQEKIDRSLKQIDKILKNGPKKLRKTQVLNRPESGISYGPSGQEELSHSDSQPPKSFQIKRPSTGVSSTNGKRSATTIHSVPSWKRQQADAQNQPARFEERIGYHEEDEYRESQIDEQ